MTGSKFGFVGAAALLLATSAPLSADDLATGQQMAAVLEPNVFQSVLGNDIRVETINEPDGFGDLLRRTDTEGLLSCIGNGPDDCGEPGVVVLFVDDWDMADEFAAWLGLPALAEDYVQARSKALPIHYTRHGTSAESLYFVTIPNGLAPEDFDPVCWARSIISTIYENGDPEHFRLAACYVAQQGS